MIECLCHLIVVGQSNDAAVVIKSSGVRQLHTWVIDRVCAKLRTQMGSLLYR